jgi:hypothetical protein
MARIDRPHKMTVQLSDEEEEFRNAIERRLGADGSGVMRQGLINLGLQLGLEFPLKKKPQPRPKP